jgi:hypothetical protein
MNLTSPILKGAIRATELSGDSATSLVQKVALGGGLFADDDGGLGMVMSGLAGEATALAVVILLSVYFRTGYRSRRDMVRHGLTAAVVLALLAFAAWDMHQAALAYLGIGPAKPAVEFEIKLPKAGVAPVNASNTISNGATF